MSNLLTTKIQEESLGFWKCLLGGHQAFRKYGILCYSTVTGLARELNYTQLFMENSEHYFKHPDILYSKHQHKNGQRLISGQAYKTCISHDATSRIHVKSHNPILLLQQLTEKCLTPNINAMYHPM